MSFCQNSNISTPSWAKNSEREQNCTFFRFEKSTFPTSRPNSSRTKRAWDKRFALPTRPIKYLSENARQISVSARLAPLPRLAPGEVCSPQPAPAPLAPRDRTPSRGTTAPKLRWEQRELISLQRPLVRIEIFRLLPVQIKQNARIFSGRKRFPSETEPFCWGLGHHFFTQCSARSPLQFGTLILKIRPQTKKLIFHGEWTFPPDLPGSIRQVSRGVWGCHCPWPSCIFSPLHFAVLFSKIRWETKKLQNNTLPVVSDAKNVISQTSKT